MPKNPDESQWVSLWREALRATSLGWELAVPIFAGVLIGHLLDRWFVTGYIFTMGLLFLGIFISYYNLARVIQRQNKQDEAQEENNAEKGDR